MAVNAAHASINGGTTVGRRGRSAPTTAARISAADAPGNSDHNSAMAPVTNGAATLVPPRVSGGPCAPRLVIATPGALRPRWPIDRPRFEEPTGRASTPQAATGITQGIRVITEPTSLPRV